MMGGTEVEHFVSDDELAGEAARAWVDLLHLENRSGPPILVSLPGGRITRKFFKEVARLCLTRRPPVLSRMHFFWGDERCVPPSDPESNYLLASETLFEPLSVDAAQIHRIHGEMEPSVSASMAEAELLKFQGVAPGSAPVFDWVFLGMGEDGHVASLFPGEPSEVRSSPKVYRTVNAPKPPPSRITLGYPVLAAARNVWVLVAGAGKAIALQDSLSAGGTTPLRQVITSRTLTRILAAI